MPCIRHFKSQTYHDFDRYRLLHKSLRRTIILLPFSVSGADDKPELHWAKRSYPLLSTMTHFESNLLQLGISFSLLYWESTFYKHMVELSVFKLTSYTSLTPLPNPPTRLSMPIASTIHTHHPCTHPSHTIRISASLVPPNSIMSLILHQ